MSNQEWLVIVATADATVSSVQCVRSDGGTAEEATRRAYEANEWMRAFDFVAAVQGTPWIVLRDDVHPLGEDA